MENKEILVLNHKKQDADLNKLKQQDISLTALCIKAITENDTKNYGILNLYLDFMPQDNKTYALLNFLIGREGINLNCKDKRLQTPLMKLCGNGFNSSLTLKLIEAGADVNSQDDCGFTALIYAVANGERAVFEALLKNSVDISSNVHMSLVLTLACNFETLDFIEIFMKYKPATYITIFSDLKSQSGMTINVITDEDSNLIYQIIYNFRSISYGCENPDIYEFLFNQENIFFSKSNGQSFLDHYLTYCDYGPIDWVNCLKTTLTSKIGPELMQEYKSHSKICTNFYKSMITKTIKNHQRHKLFKMWVSLGPPVKSMDDIFNAFITFGFDDVESVIYNIGSYFLTSTKESKYYLLNLICGVSSNYDYKEILWHIENINDDCVYHRQIKFVCKFFTIPVSTRLQLLGRGRRFSEKIMAEKYNKAPKFVPMKELCRNACRKYITEYCKPAHPREFYEIINSLRVPIKITDYIKFKIPDL